MFCKEESLIPQESVDSNSTNSNNFRDYFFITLYSLTCIFAFFGNGLVCKIIFSKKNLHNFVNILLGNMSVSDLLCGVTWPIRLLVCREVWIDFYGNQFCLVNKFVQLLTFQVSSIVMTIIAIDRLVLFSSPFQLMRRKGSQSSQIRSWIFSILSWILSIGIIFGTSPSLAYEVYNFGINNNNNNKSSPIVSCGLASLFGQTSKSPVWDRVRLIVANSCHFWIPLIVTTVCYGRISVIVWRREFGDMSLDSWLNQRWKTIKMLIAVVAVFILCWIPFFIHNLIVFIHCPNQRRPCDQSYGFLITIWLAFSSCCFNPLIYWWMNDEFRSNVKKLFCCCPNEPKPPRSSISTIITMLHRGSHPNK